LRILNEGKTLNDFNYEIIDDLNWFNQENGQTQISPNGEITLTFTGSVTGEEDVDTIIFSVVPKNHQENGKSVSFRVYKI
jgi:hypothetical protein